jgi:uncharacterized membrane protein YqjE
VDLVAEPMKHPLYYPAALFARLTGGPSLRTTTTAELTDQWGRDIVGPSLLREEPVTLSLMEKRAAAFQAMALAYLHLTFAMFGVVIVATLVSRVFGAAMFYAVALATAAVVGAALTLQIKKQIVQSQLEKFQLMLPDERKDFYVSSWLNPGAVDVVAALLLCWFFLALWW